MWLNIGYFNSWIKSLWVTQIFIILTTINKQTLVDTQTPLHTSSLTPKHPNTQCSSQIYALHTSTYTTLTHSPIPFCCKGISFNYLGLYTNAYSKMHSIKSKLVRLVDLSSKTKRSVLTIHRFSGYSNSVCISGAQKGDNSNWKSKNQNG